MADRMSERLEHTFKSHRDRVVRSLVQRLGDRCDAEDAAQIAAMRLWQLRGRLRDDSLEALFFIAGRNAALDLMRERKRRASQVVSGELSDSANLVADPTPLPDRACIASQDLEYVLERAKSLSPKCRRAFIGKTVLDQSYADLAEEMGVSQSMVRKYVIAGKLHCQYSSHPIG